MGVNGCGKSTLIKLLTKEQEPDTGTVFHAERLEVAYFEQNRESLDPELSVFKTICPTGDHVEFAGNMIHARSYLSRFLFHQQQMDTPVRKLSGGEQSRLLLARVMLTRANLLVLDEPTNDLDIATLDSLSNVLQDFNGAIILVTHDRYFLDQMTNLILAFGIDETGAKIILPMVGLDQWQQWHEQQMVWQEKLQQAKASQRNSQKSEPTKKAPETKPNKNLAALESKIEAAEENLQAIQNQVLVLSPTDTQKLIDLTSQMAKVQKEIDDLYNQL